MPYKKSYSGKTMKTGGSRTPKSVMGGQGKSAHIKGEHYMGKKTKSMKFMA